MYVGRRGVVVIDVGGGRSGSIWGCWGVLGGVGAVEIKDVSPFWELISKQGGIRRDLGLGL